MTGCCMIGRKCADFPEPTSHSELLRMLKTPTFVSDCREMLATIEDAANADDKDLTDLLVYHFNEFENPVEVYELVRQLESILEALQASQRRTDA